MAKTKSQSEPSPSGLGSVISELPVDRLKTEAQEYGKMLGQHGIARIGKSVEGMTGKLNDYAQGGSSTKGKAAKNIAKGDSPVKAVAKAAGSKAKDTMGGVKDAVGNAVGNIGGGDGGKKLKVTNIVEYVDVPVGRDVAYAQWTQFEDFPTFMKKVENVKQESDEVVTWQAQVFWSHRSWKATIVDQVPGERIVWKSEGEKGRVDGAVTFHELAPDLTRVLVTLEYHPKGLFEHTGNLWRAQGRRVRLEMRHFRRHVASETILHPDEVDGWEGEIHDEEVQESGGSKEGSGSSSSSKSSNGSQKRSSRSSSSSGRQRGAKKSSSARKQTSRKRSSSSRKEGSGS